MSWTNRIGGKLKLRDLHVFLAVADHGNMAKAAQALAISRPVVSKTIAEMEQSLGVSLFDRSKHGVRATVFGRALEKRGLAIFDDLKQSVDELRFMSDPGSGEVRVGCTEIMAAGLVAAAIDQMSARYPRMAFLMEVGSAATRLDLLRHRRCEVVIGRHRVTDADGDLAVEPLFYERLFIAAGPKSGLLRRRSLSLADLANEAWILTRDEVGDHSPLAEAYRTAKLARPKPRVVSDSLNLRKGLLPTGRFISTIPGSILPFAPPAEMKPLRIKLPRWQYPIAMIALKNTVLTPAARLFAERVRDLSRKVQG